MKKRTVETLHSDLSAQLAAHIKRIDSDPQANEIKLLAYDISRDVEEREIAFRDIEGLVKTLSDKGAIARAQRLMERSGANDLAAQKKAIVKLAKDKTKLGYDGFKAWAENPGQGIVLTAHPTFSLSRDIRDCLGAMASTKDAAKRETLHSHLKTLPYLPKRAPTLQEEHADTQAAIDRIQGALRDIHHAVITVAREAFPEDWARIVPRLATVYSWVGYDIDGRTDISWGDAIRLRLEEKSTQLARYHSYAQDILNSKDGAPAGSEALLEQLVDQLANAKASAERDLAMFGEDLTNPDNLVAAANNLTRKSPRRMLSLSDAIQQIDTIIRASDRATFCMKMLVLQSDMINYGLGTSRIHFRLNARHVMSGVKAVFGISGKAADNRTLLMRASKLTKNVKPQPVNFASLALEKSTAHQQMILTAQIHKYIDADTPIRLLIAECEDSLTPLGMLYLARRYGLEQHMDISPLFETADALNNGGRIIDKMLSNKVYRSYIEQRGCFAIQTGFSDAGRFMGQIPATLAIERLQSHFAAALIRHKVKDVTAIVFNTHGEGNGRGGHPGNITARMDYAMSPWAVDRFTRADIALTHETSFQGGDGFMWFQTPQLAAATVSQLIVTRAQDTSGVEDDPFYSENDFSWDIYRTLSSQQDSLYHDPNYVSLLGGFGQNLLIPTGSRAAKRAKAGSDMFDPRQLRAIPHNAILQQMGVPANIFYGLGRAGAIDPEKFVSLFETSPRARSIFGLALTSMKRSNISILTGYARLFDPAFWISRALSGNEPRAARSCLTVADTLSTSEWTTRLGLLANRLRMDVYDSVNYIGQGAKAAGWEAEFTESEDLKILHALRLALVMKMLMIATELPAHGEEDTAQLNVLQKLQTFQIDSVLSDLKERYPAVSKGQSWTEELTEKTDTPVAPPGGFPHISETIIKPLERASQIVRQITVAITHEFDAYG